MLRCCQEFAAGVVTNVKLSMSMAAKTGMWMGPVSASEILCTSKGLPGAIRMDQMLCDICPKCLHSAHCQVVCAPRVRATMATGDEDAQAPVSSSIQHEQGVGMHPCAQAVVE